MHQFLSLAFLAICILVGGASNPYLIAQDCEELLKERAWVGLNPDEKPLVERPLRLLVCEVIPNRGLLDPSKAHSAAREQLAISIRAFLQSSQSDNELLLEKLNSVSPEAIVEINRLEEYRDLLRVELEDLPATSSPQKLDLYIGLVDAMESLLFLLEHGKDYKSPEDYKNLLGELKKALIEYAGAPRSRGEIETLGNSIGLLEAFAAADKAAKVDDLLYALREVCKKPNLRLYVSEELINDFLDSAVPPINRPESVRECILGTSIFGTATVSANASITLRESSERAALTVHLDGTSATDTYGIQKPVRITSKGMSSFRAEKCVTIPDFGSGRASASACTRTTICSIKKMGRQCLSRLIERIAWKRAFQQKSLAEAIAAGKLARRVETNFDERLDPALVKARKFYDDRFRSPLLRLDIFPTELKFSSTLDEVGMGAAFARPHEIGATKAPQIETPSDSVPIDLTVAIHDSFHRNLFRSKRVTAAALDQLVEEFLSNLPVGKDGTSPKYDPQLFKVIFEVLRNADPERAGELKEKLPSGKLELINVFGDNNGWIIIQWRMQKGQ